MHRLAALDCGASSFAAIVATIDIVWVTSCGVVAAYPMCEIAQCSSVYNGLQVV
jgi:hypothetical protein